MPKAQAAGIPNRPTRKIFFRKKGKGIASFFCFLYNTGKIN